MRVQTFSLLLLVSIFASEALYAKPTVFTVGERVPNDVIIKYKAKRAGVVSSSSAISSTRSFIKSTIGASTIKSIHSMQVDHVKLKAHQNVDKTIQEIETLPDVEYAEPNYIVKVGNQPNYIPDLNGEDAWGLLNIEADKAWISTIGNANIIVAIIDSGIDLDHPDLQNNIWINSSEDLNGDNICDWRDNDNIDQDGNGYIDDCNGWNFVENNNDPNDDLNHGTHVAGIVGGIGEDDVYGVSRVVQLMPVKFIASDGYGTTADAIKSIVYAVDNGARILNNSWGGTFYSRALEDAVNYSNDRGALFVAAAGNEATNNDADPHYPSNYGAPNVLSVGASSSYNELTTFSNFGSDSVDVVAPGDSILSTIRGGYYTIFSGTSMAAPFAAGVAALVLSVHPELSGYDLKRVLMESTDAFTYLSGQVVTAGRINADSAIKLADAGLSLDPMFSMTPQITDPNKIPKTSTASYGCGRITEGSTENSSDIPAMLVVIFLPLMLVIMRKKRNKNLAKMGNLICRYFC